MMGAIEEDSREPQEMENMLDEGLKEYNRTHNNPYEIGASYGWVIMPYQAGMVDLDEYIAIADEKMYKMRKERDAHRR